MSLILLHCSFTVYSQTHITTRRRRFKGDFGFLLLTF